MTDERLGTLFDNGPFGFLVVGHDERIVDANPASYRMLGYSNAELIGRLFAEITHPDDVDADDSLAEQLSRGALPFLQCERRFVRRDGSIVWTRLTASIYQNPDGPSGCWLVMLEEISQYKRTEEALRSGEAKRRALLSAIPDAIFQIGRDGVYLDFIPAKGFELLVSPEEFLGRRIEDVLPPDVAEPALFHISRVLDTGETQSYEYELVVSGTERSYEARIVPAGGDTVLAVVREITERKRTEEALRESEQRLRTLVEHAPEALVIFDVDSERFIDVNENAVRLYGRSRAELLRLGPIQLSPPAQPDGRSSHEAAAEQIAAALKGETPVFEWVRGSITNITHRREVAEALRASRDVLRAVFDASPLPTLMLDRDGYVRMWNRAAERTFGWGANEVIGRPPPFVPQTKIGEFNALRHHVLQTKTAEEIETTRVTKNGVLLEVSLSSAPLLEGGGAVVGIVNVLADITSRKRAETALRESEVKYRALVEHATYGIFRASQEGRFLAVNPALAEMLGYDSEDELLAANIASDVCLDPGRLKRLMTQAAMTDRIDDVETKWKRKDGTIITVRLSGRMVRGADGRIEAVEMIVEDVTQQRALQAQLRHAQKMEGIGQLTGGIAHDFNNILTAVLANAELIASALPEELAALRAEVDDIRGAVRRGAAMIRKLMAFSRREHLDMRPIDMAGVVEDLVPMLRRLLPEHIEIEATRAEDGATARADRNAIEQVVLNLATNARDAMPDGGVLNIGTTTVILDERYRALHGWGDPGEYVCLCVSDTGSGMEDALRSKIFEPFFTTKPQGEGTGLGMAMVYGLVKQHGGFIDVESQVDHGTVVKVYFPVVPDLQLEGVPVPPPRQVTGGTEAILLVEDEESIRRASRRVLERYGYTVLVAPDGLEAFSLLKDPTTRVDLVITDVVMPRLGGRKLYDAVRAEGIDVRFIFTSGYAERDVQDRIQLDPQMPFLHKPWTVADLLMRVREVLDEEIPVPEGQLP
jgi:PAS domain S-box-containing protein